LATAVLATLLGTLAALGMTRGNFPGCGLLTALFLAPLVVPIIDLAVGDYFVWALGWQVGPVGFGGSLAGTVPGLVLAHTVLAFPFPFLTVSTSLTTVDRTLELAAGGLGANPWKTFQKITLPLIRTGVITGAIFAFLTSCDEVVLDGLTSSGQDGEFISLLGPSGSGKTTALRLIAGFLQPDGGSIAVNGKDITNLPVHRRNIGMVFQSYALFPHMTVGQNIAFGLEQRRFIRKEITKAVDESLDMVRLKGFASRRPAELSGGQQQRVALARALVFKPQLLLLDESLSALDKKLRVQMQLELRQIQKAVGVTAVFVTHDHEE